MTFVLGTLISPCSTRRAFYVHMKILQQKMKILPLNTYDFGATSCGQDVESTIKRYLELEVSLKAGLTKAIGVSNFNAQLLAQLIGDKRTTVVPANNQCNHAIANHNESRHGQGRDPGGHGGDDDTVKFCQAHGIAYSAYSPLEGLSGGSVMKIPAVVAIGKAHSVSAAQVRISHLK